MLIFSASSLALELVPRVASPAARARPDAPSNISGPALKSEYEICSGAWPCALIFGRSSERPPSGPLGSSSGRAPCKADPSVAPEVAQWLVFEQPMTLSLAQWQDFKAVFSSPSANRPIQPLGSRMLSKSYIEELNRSGGLRRVTSYSGLPNAAYVLGSGTNTGHAFQISWRAAWSAPCHDTF